MLARSVRTLERITLVRNYGGNVDNRRAGGLSQFRQCRLAKEIRSLRVQVHDPVIVFFRYFLKVLVLRDAGAINHDIQAAETLHRILNQAFPESTVRAIKKLQARGIKAVIATGRDLVEMEKLPLQGIKFDGYLTLNGNICLDENKKMFAGNEIAPDEVEVLVNIFKAGRIPFVLIGEKQRYINYVDDVVIQTQMSTHGTIPDIGEYHGEKIYQCLAFVDAKTREKLERLLDKCSITSWNDTGIDIIAKTGGKAAGIQKFLDREQILRSQTMAFGDGENDRTMLKYAGTGIALGNGSELLKKDADYITDDIDENGVRNALIHFGLLGEDE
jgi:Cof subfamily protein (haloacid dehalogenase superfamily)